MKLYLQFIFSVLFSFGANMLMAQVTMPSTGFNIIPCGTNTTLCDPGGCNNNYPSNSSGYTVIRATGNSQITISGSFTHEPYFDYFVIYDGVGTGGTIIMDSYGYYSGTLNPYTAAPGQSLTIQFISDGSFNYSGFNFNVSFSDTCAAITAVPENGTLDIACGTNTILVDNAGIATDYTANNNSIVHLNNGQGALLNLYGTYNLNTGDTIFLYSGIGTTNLITRYVGNGVLNFNSNLGESITLVFFSNGTLQSKGFDFLLSYNGMCVCPTTTYTGITQICEGDTTVIHLNTTTNNTYSISDIPYAPLPCSSVSSGLIGDDVVTAPITLPFVFNFFGQDFTQLGISSNGNIQLGAGPYNDAFTSIGPIPGTNVRNMIALNYSDWMVSGTGASITYQTVGTAPNRIFQICFNNLRPYGGTGNLTGQILLYETTNIVEMHIDQSLMPATYINQTQGLQYSNGVGVGYPGRNFNYWTATSTAIRFDPNVYYSWTPTTGGIDITDTQNPTFTSTVVGDYTYVYTYDFGYCYGLVDSVTFTVGNINVNYDVQNLNCFADNSGSIALASGAASSFIWSTGDTSNSIINLAAGFYSVTASSGSCEVIDTFSITEPALLVTNINVSDISCNNPSDGSLDLVTTGGILPYSYLWSDGSTSQSLLNLAAGDYYATITDNNGCTTSVNQTLYVAGVSMTLVSAIDSICFGASNGTIEIAVLPNNSTILWSNGSTSAQIQNLAAGQYTTTVTNTNIRGILCQEVATFDIVEPNIPFMSDIRVIEDIDCINPYGHLLVSAAGGYGAYVYSWSNGLTTTDATNLNAGNYSVTVTDALGCIVSSSAIINPISMPILSAYIGQVGVKTIEVDLQTLVNLSSTLSDSTLLNLWSFSWEAVNHGYLPSPTNTNNSSVQINSAGEYYYRITSQYGDCSLSDSLKVVVVPSEFAFPTAFTPNNDGENDLFRPVNFSNQYLKNFKIFNRWGQLVYESSAEASWDGFYKGETQPRDVYMYVLEYQMPRDNSTQVNKGQFTLLR